MAGPRPVLVIITGRHRPHELAFLLLAVTVGLAYTLGAPPPQSAAVLMPRWLVDMWAWGFLIHGVSGVLAVLAPRRQLERGLWLELGSMLIGIGAPLLAGAAAFSFVGWKALLGGGLTLAWAAANAVRAGQILRDLRSLRSPQ